MKLFELQASDLGRDLDTKIQGIGNGIAQGNNQPETPQGAIDSDTSQPIEPDEDEEPPKKVDSYLVASTKNHPFVTDYDWKEDERLNPYKILQMDLAQLNSLRTLVRTKINMKSYTDQVGLYDDPGMKFYQDLMSFVEKVIGFKKKSDVEQQSSLQKDEKPKDQKAPTPPNPV